MYTWWERKYCQLLLLMLAMYMTYYGLRYYVHKCVFGYNFWPQLSPLQLIIHAQMSHK